MQKKIIALPLIFIFALSAGNNSMAGEDLALHEVADNVYAIVGSLGNRTPENLGNNATFGFVVTSAGVVLIDSGGTYKGAEKLHEIIKSVSDKNVVAVINTGGQDHRWLGNEYFQRLGAELVAAEAAVVDQKNRRRDQFFVLGNLVGNDGLQDTDAVHARSVFDDELQFTSGDTVFELYHAGHAHTPGDSFVWLPQQKVMFTGDIVYTERMLNIGDQSNSKSWIEAYQAMASFNPRYVVPGHGLPTTLARANSDTYDYLVFLRRAVADFMQSGGDVSDISSIDQSQYEYLVNYELLAGRNAQRVYTELEWE